MREARFSSQRLGLPSGGDSKPDTEAPACRGTPHTIHPPDGLVDEPLGWSSCHIAALVLQIDPNLSVSPQSPLAERGPVRGIRPQWSMHRQSQYEFSEGMLEISADRDMI